MLSLVPYQLEQNGYAVSSALVAVGWMTLTLSVLALMHSFLSAVASMMMLAAVSIPGYEEISRLHRKSIIEANNSDI
jgi:hypothetical protein